MISEMNTVLITGCNRGIGLEFVKQYLLLDWRVIATCRNPDKANDIKDHTFLFSAASLSNLLIYALYKEFDDNQYIDIGSALSPLLGLKGWRGTRVYLRCYWEGERNPIITQEDSWG